MYLFKIGKPKRRMMIWKHKAVNEQLIPVIDRPGSTPVMSEIDMSQSGSGMNSVRDKLKQIDLHKGSGKKKYNKFISLNL
jgi:hypothetical protein